MISWIGLFTAIVAWGSYTVPLKRYHGVSPLRFQFWMSLGIGLSSLLLGVWRGFPSFTWMGVMAGLVWSGGALLSFYAIQKEGLAGAASRWMGTGILASFISGVFLLNEIINLTWALVGIFLLISSLTLISQAEPNLVNPKNPLRYWRSILSGLIFGNYVLPLPYSGVAAIDFVAPMGLGILLGGIILNFFAPKSAWAPPHTSLGSGLAWNMANVGSLFAVQGFGFAVGFPLTQLALLVSLAWSVGFFGEFPSKKSRFLLLIGAILLLIGAACLGLARKF